MESMIVYIENTDIIDNTVRDVKLLSPVSSRKKWEIWTQVKG